MQRLRYIAASPVRRADETWAVIVSLLADTLDLSPVIKRAEVVEAFDIVGSIGPRLVAAHHLEKSPIMLLADPIHLSIYSVSGARTMSIQENLSPVPGGSSVAAWKVHLPAPEAIAADISAAVAKSNYLTVEFPPTSSNGGAANTGLLDLEALARNLSKDRP